MCHLEEHQNLVVDQDARGISLVHQLDKQINKTYAMFECKQLGQNSIQKCDFSRRAIYTGVDLLARVDNIFHFGEHKRMLANLAELHNGVVQALDTGLFAIKKSDTSATQNSSLSIPLGILRVRKQHSMLLELHVQLALQSAHLALDNLFNLVRQLAFDILLQATKQEWTKHFVQAPDNQQRLFFIQLNLIPCARIGKRSVEPLVKRFDAVKDFGQSKVEQSPQFGEIVLESSSVSAEHCWMD